MHDTDSNDLSDDADYAASLHQGPGGDPMADGGRGGGGQAEPAGCEVVYQKDNVTIHPTQYASERISGRLRLLKKDSSLFMSWIPYKERSTGYDQMAQSSHSMITEKDRNLYTIKAVPVTEVRSIRRHTPAIGWQYLIVVLSSGLAYPPLYFYNGGLREFMATIKQHVLLVRSADDANVFLINDMQDPLQRSLSSLELPRAVPVSDGVLRSSSSSVGNQNMIQSSASSEGPSLVDRGGRMRQRAHDPAHDLSIQVLEKFSLVTKFARDTTSHFLREIHHDNHERKDHVVPAPTTAPSRDSNEDRGDVVKVPAAKDNVEVDKLSLVWGKPRLPPLFFEEWENFLDSEGRVTDPNALRKRIFYGGLEHKLRKDIWKLLLGYHSYDSTHAEREYLSSIKKSEYEIIKYQWKSISSQQARRYTKFRERRGLIEKDVVRTDRAFVYYDGDDNPRLALLHDILLTYSFYNFDLGYCQGMSDLLAPILFVMEDESEAFWCFAALMERLGPNFNRDQSGMHSQLFALSKLVELLDGPLHNYFKRADCLNYFFCFRWILIQFKREFEYEMVMRMWEVLWTHHLSEHFHLYICVAILRRYRKKIMGDEMDFDTLLKFINELSGQIDLDGILRDAEALCICAGENGAACIPPGTPPSLPCDNELLVNSPQDDEIL